MERDQHSLLSVVQHVLLCAGILLGYQAFGQKQANVWLFGEGAGLTFNTTPPTAFSGGQTYYPPPNEWNEGTSAICDSTGSLLFYTNGTMIWDREHQVMPTGGDLMGHPSSTQAALIVALPGSERFFHVFTTDASENMFENGLRHSVVDICLRDGLGDVVAGQKNLLLQPNTAEKLAAIPHANGTDYWIISHGYNTNEFYVFLLTASGITGSFTQAIGPGDHVGYGGQITASPDGSKLAYASPTLQGFLALFEFNRATGVLSNARVWPATMPRMPWGVAFSPSGNKLYFTTGNSGSLRQLDLTAGSWANIQTSEVVLATLVPARWYDLRLGPNGLIYVTHSGTATLGTISYPDLTGAACQFQDNSVTLSATCSFGLPNIVSGYSYNNHVEECETPNGIQEEGRAAVIAYPNPTTDRTILRFGPIGTRARVALFDSRGARLLDLPVRQRSMELSVSELPQGIYTIVFTDGGARRHDRLVVIR